MNIFLKGKTIANSSDWYFSNTTNLETSSTSIQVSTNYDEIDTASSVLRHKELMLLITVLATRFI